MKRALTIALLALAAAAGWAGYRVTRFPAHEGQVPACEVGAPVTIRRDAHGVPHIEAASARDAYFALGFCEAQDRTFQLEVFRRAASGTVAELVGEGGLEIDRISRTVGFRRIGERQLQNASPLAVSLTAAFTDGINAGLHSLRHVPIELALLGKKPEPWTAVDCMALARLLSFGLAEDMKTELLFGRLRERLGAERALLLLPKNELPDARTDRALGPLPEARGLLASLDALEATLPRPACSSWIAGGDRSASGKPLFGYDSHQGGPRVPGEVYLVHMKGGPDLDVAGGVLVGMPGIYCGVTREIAFAPTNLGGDAQDLLVVERASGDPASYVLGGKARPFERRTESIAVRGEKGPRTLEVLETALGPVVSDTLPGAAAPSSSSVLVLRWQGARPELALDGFVTMPLARDWPSFRACLARFEAASQHFNFACADGTIAYQVIGPLPRRTEAPLPWPRAATEADLEPEPLLTLDELPHLVNPGEEFVATANHEPPLAGKPFYLGRTFVTPARHDRLVECVSARTGMTMKDLEEVGQDLISPFARRLAPRLAAILHDAPQAGADERWVAEKLVAWDHRMAGDRVEPALFHALFSEVCRALLEDELGPDLLAYAGRTEHGSERIASMIEEPEEGVFWDDVRTSERESRAAIVVRAARRTLALLATRLGKDRARWRWDALHTLTYEHYLHGVTTALDAGPFPVPGDDDTPFRFGEKPLDESFRAQVVTLCRIRADLGEPSSIEMIVSTGQSSWAFHPNAKDAIATDLAGGLWKIAREPDAVRREAAKVLTLLPR